MLFAILLLVHFSDIQEKSYTLETAQSHPLVLLCRRPGFIAQLEHWVKWTAAHCRLEPIINIDLFLSFTFAWKVSCLCGIESQVVTNNRIEHILSSKSDF